VFHCAAGKDRTGMVAAMLLGVLGVAEEDILDDYELTSAFRRSEALAEAVERMRERSEMAPAVIAGVMRTPRWALRAALHQVALDHGGFEGFVTGPGGAEADVPARLRDLLLEPA
jgi:protein-tyrosine phosphatase